MKLLSLIFFGLAGLSAWIMWGPLLHWLLRLAGDSGIAKIVCVALVGYFGGIAVPIVLVILAVAALIERA